MLRQATTTNSKKPEKFKQKLLRTGGPLPYHITKKDKQQNKLFYLCGLHGCQGFYITSEYSTLTKYSQVDHVRTPSALSTHAHRSACTHPTENPPCVVFIWRISGTKYRFRRRRTVQQQQQPEIVGDDQLSQVRRASAIGCTKTSMTLHGILPTTYYTGFSCPSRCCGHGVFLKRLPQRQQCAIRHLRAVRPEPPRERFDCVPTQRISPCSLRVLLEVSPDWQNKTTKKWFQVVVEIQIRIVIAKNADS